ncbi:MAG: zinc ribbon domain-containing protein [Proteobacteria bacterium]|nr:zinc ribbon domain-containing protein [Pseudomonadota bacterium]
MKCPHCGADVEAQRFCIYCGSRLSSKEMRVQRAVCSPSGVMRIRHKSPISATSLPDVQTRQPSKAESMNLSSLSSRQTAVERHTSENPVAWRSSQELPSARRSGSMDGGEMRESQSSTRQSRELEDLLSKLYGKPVENEKKIIDSLDEEEDLMEEHVDEVRDDSPLEISVDLSESELSEPSLSGEHELSGDYEACESLNESFFDETPSQTDISGPLPVGSGTFARVPSGGFHLVWESVKSACQNAVAKVRSITSRRSSKKVAENNAVKVEDTGCNDLPAEQKKKLIAYAITAALVVGIAAIIASVVAGHEECPEIAAQAVTGNENFEIQPIEATDEGEDLGIPIEDLTFEDDDFSIPALELDDNNKDAKGAKKPAVADAKPVKAVAAGTNRLTEARLYSQKDNIMANVVKGETFKTRKSCIMRQGPASRFGLVKEIKAGTNIQILTSTEEDWVLESGSVWKKAGEAPRLGPGSMFAPAQKGMSVPQAKSRVISAKNWKYIQVGDLYGYVGPACFKP